jgi:hypothetical protein
MLSGGCSLKTGDAPRYVRERSLATNRDRGFGCPGVEIRLIGRAGCAPNQRLQRVKRHEDCAECFDDV